MVCRSPCHSSSNGGVEQVNRTMQEKLGAWMKDCKLRQWTIGSCLMMWQYNTQNYRTIGNIPCCLVFGQLPRVGISALPLNASVLTQLATEAQPNRVCDYVGKVNVLDNVRAMVEAIGMRKRMRQLIVMRFRPTPPTAITTSMWQQFLTTMSTVAVRQMTT